MDCGEVRGGVFGVASGDSAPAFEVEEGVLYEMAQLVKVGVIFSEHFAVSSGWNDRLHALPFGLFHDGVAVIAFVGDQVSRLESIHQARSKCAIRRGAICNKDSDRQTKRIHGQMYFAVEPPFERSMSWLPPRAPAAWGCTLMWLASIISHSRSGSSMRTSSNPSQIPLSRQRMKRRWVLLQPPISGGKSRHGAPVRRIQNTALINWRLSLALPPHAPALPGK